MMTTVDKIVKGMAESRFGGSMMGAGDIAHVAGVAESTVRRWLPKLIFEHHYVRHTSYVGQYALSPEGHAHAATLDEEKAA
jgi:DNA-binding IclR family transcriptional regulator